MTKHKFCLSHSYFSQFQSLAYKNVFLSITIYAGISLSFYYNDLSMTEVPIFKIQETKSNKLGQLLSSYIYLLHVCTFLLGMYYIIR